MPEGVVFREKWRIAADLKAAGQAADANTEIIALIAYLQRLGVDIKSWHVPAAATAVPAISPGVR